ncbi:hypothetical protein BU25DRAFT_86384 [Macroventuria anomochaeta]|uniref:Uncharacterized protein n=1 Tax=Macroventuria anomochaeta TaxID=301207 RepID=A0ACB6SG47_9PLEO|nr:uncharacterized protein BU25DRAFT_86384 [Macroventuria anomochaeta]KAF2632942.1 hypothetical protein BU25DRAFT_86384 [Macroventuria anomochaeta]
MRNSDGSTLGLLVFAAWGKYAGCASCSAPIGNIVSTIALVVGKLLQSFVEPSTPNFKRSSIFDDNQINISDRMFNFAQTGRLQRLTRTDCVNAYAQNYRSAREASYLQFPTQSYVTPTEPSPTTRRKLLP